MKIMGRLCAGVAGGALLAAAASAQMASGSASEPTASVAAAGVTQTASDSGLAEIVVTAQKRAQNLQTVPVAAQTITAQQLVANGVSDLIDLPQVSSSINIIDLGYTQPFVRGVGSTVSGTGFYSAVSSYVDGVYIPRTNSLNSGAGGIDDAESVVVLKGPQGSLYGRNATGGAIVITSRTPHPGDPFSGEARAGYGNYDDRQFSARVATGLGDIAGISLTGNYEKNDGYIRDLSDGSRGGNKNIYNFAGKIALEPTSNIDVGFSARYSRSLIRFGLFRQFAVDDSSGAIPGLNNPQTLYAGTLISFGLPAELVIPAAAGLRFSPGGRTTYDNEVNGYTNGMLTGTHLDKSFQFNRDILLSGNIRIKFDKFDIVAVTGYNDNHYNSAAEVLGADPTSVPSFGLGAPAVGFSAKYQTTAFSQELQLVSKGSPIEYIAGVNYFTEGGPVLQTGDAFGFSALIADTTWRDRAYSAFAQATVPLGKFHLTLGGRYNSETYRVRDDIDTATTGVPNVGRLRRHDNNFTYDAKIDYRAGDVLVYAGTSTGIKSGSLNPNNPAAGSTSPEKITSYEGGFKSEFADRRVRLNGAIFYYNYDNIQLNVLVPPSSTFLVNGSKAQVLGAELEFVARPVDNFSFFVNATLLDTKYKRDAVFAAGGGAVGILNIKGKKLVAAPDAAVNVGGEWTVPFVHTGELKLNASARFNSGYWLNSVNTYGTGGSQDDGFTTVNASLTYTAPGGHLSITGWVDNAFDEFYVPSGIDAAGGLTQVGTVGRPREYGLRVGYKF